MGWFDDARDYVEDKVDDAKDTVDDAVDEAQDVAEDVGDAVDDAVDSGQEAVEDVQEGASDVVNEVTEGDLGGAVDEATDTVQDVASGDADVGSSGGSSSGGSSSSGTPSGSKKPSDNVDSGGGEDKAPQTKEQLKKFLGLGKQKTKDAGKKLDNLVNETEAKDNDIINNDAIRNNEPNLFETGAERQLSYATGFQGESFNSKAFNNSLRAENFYTGNRRIEQAEDQITTLNNQISKVRSAESSTVLLDTNGPAEGGVQEVSKSQALEILKEDKTGLQEDIDKIQKNQLSRLENIGKVNDQIQKDRNTITEKEAETLAKQQDLSQKGIDLTFFGKKFGEAKGGLAELSIITDTALSSKSGELVGASVDQFIGSDKGDKTVEQVAEENAILGGQQLEKKGFQPLNEAGDVLTSIPGIVGTSLVGGAVFSGGSKVVGALPKIGSQAQKLYQGAGAVAGAYTVAKQGQKTKQQLEAGKEAEAIGTITETGAGLTGFVKGSRAFNKRYGTRTGSTSISQKNLLRSSGNKEFSGFGNFKGETNIVNTIVRSPYTRDSGLRSPVKTVKDGTVETTGRYSLTGGRSSSQGQGQFKVQYPSGSSKTGSFEFLSNIRGRGETPTGNRYSLSSDTTRFQTEGKLFRYFKDSTTSSKSIKQGRERVSPNEVLNNFERLPSISKDARPQKVELSTTNAESSKFGNVENYILRGGSSSSSASSSGVSTKTQGRGGFSGLQASPRFRGLANSKAESYARSQNPSGSTFTSSTSSSSSQSTQNEGSGSSQNEASTFSSLGSSELQTFRDRAYSQRSIQVPETGNNQTQEQQDGSVGSTASISSGGGTTSTVKRRKQGFKERRGLEDKTGSDLGLGTNQGQQDRLGTGNIGRQGNKGIQRGRNDLEDLGKVGLGVTGKAGTTPGLATGTLQIPQLKNPQKTEQRSLLSTSQITTPAQTLTTPKFGGAGLLGFNRGTRSAGRIDGEGFGSRAGTQGYIKTDWFSANLVEQTSDEQAKFDLSTAPASNPLFGLKTTQEQKGKTPERNSVNLDIEIY